MITRMAENFIYLFDCLFETIQWLLRKDISTRDCIIDGCEIYARLYFVLDGVIREPQHDNKERPRGLNFQHTDCIVSEPSKRPNVHIHTKSHFHL